MLPAHSTRPSVCFPSSYTHPCPDDDDREVRAARILSVQEPYSQSIQAAHPSPPPAASLEGLLLGHQYLVEFGSKVTAVGGDKS